MPHQNPDSILVTVNYPGVADIPPEPSVGRIYEIGINGEGYMLHDSPEDPERQLRRAVISLDPPRLATTETPFSEAVERYSFATFNDWEAGRGQRWLHREGSTGRAYWDSEGLDPFRRGDLTLLPAMTRILDTNTPHLRIVSVGEDLYAQVSANQLRRWVSGTGTWDSPFSLGSVTVTDLASDGQFWYAAAGTAGIFRGTSSPPGSAWSTINARQTIWAGGRLCVAAVATGSTPNRFTTLSGTGAEEKAGGHLTLPDGHTIVLGGSAAGTVWFGSYVGDRGTLWGWPLGVTDTGDFHVPVPLWDMPQGVIPVAVYAAAGEVWVRALRVEGSGEGEVLIYRAIPAQGLTPFLVAELGRTHREGAFAEVGDLVLFSWSNAAETEASLGAVYLPTGGHARWLSPHVDGPIVSITETAGQETIAVRGHGVYRRSNSTYETSGWWRSSVADGASALDKVLDSVLIETGSLPSGASVEVSYSLDAGGSYVSAGTIATTGARRAEYVVNRRAGAFALKLDVTGPGTQPVTVHMAQMTYHPLGLADRLTVFPVKCFDNMTGLNGHPLPTNGPGRGAALMRKLESLGQSRILLQDIDWHLTGHAEVVEVVGVETRPVAIYDPHQAHNTIGGVVYLTVRKVGA